ncbi:MAG: hypothetical protein ACOYLP_00485 [Flavobacterium sp.]|jgi:hypothetical protein|uniref:hypothetical protein n=1 Tax=Flavobacterium sp. TaxID=239 RepID=UPI003BD740B8
MKIKFLAGVVFFTLFFSACKDEKSKENQPEAEKVVVESKVSITVDMVVPVDDSFQIFYTEDNTLNFSEEKCVRVNIQGKPTSQKIVFNFPDEVAFTFLRFDVGENKLQKEMKINDFLIKYYDKKFEAKGNLFLQYFAPNDQLKVDMAKATFVPQDKDPHDPIFYPLEPLGVELNKLIK